MMFGFQPDHEQRIKQTGFEAVLPVIGAIGSVAQTIGILGGKKSAAPLPVAEKPTVMPTPDDDAIKRARQRSIAAQLARSGRQSTILSTPESDFFGA